MFYKDGFFWGMHLIWWAIWLLLLGWIFFFPTKSSYRETEEDNPLTALRIRFAKGEITKDEYVESKKDLGLDE